MLILQISACKFVVFETQYCSFIASPF